MDAPNRQTLTTADKACQNPLRIVVTNPPLTPLTVIGAVMSNSSSGESSGSAERPVRRFGHEVDRARLHAITDRLSTILTSPEFLEQVRWVFEAPEEERLVAASQRLSVKALRGLGLDLPKDFRVSSRYFESNWPVAVELGDYPDGQPNPVNQRNQEDPGALDRLRLEDPESFWQFVIKGRRVENLQLGTIIPELPPDQIAWGACGGGGAFTICGCAGYST